MKLIGFTVTREPHPYDEAIEHPICWWRDGAQHIIGRARPGEAPDGTCAVDVLAACTTFEAAVAASALMSGAAYYPIWRARRDANENRGG